MEGQAGAGSESAKTWTGYILLHGREVSAGFSYKTKGVEESVSTFLTDIWTEATALAGKLRFERWERLSRCNTGVEDE